MSRHKVESRHTRIYHVTKVRESKIYLCNTPKGWYRIYRQGQRSWEAVCVMPPNFTDYRREDGKTIKGNADTILQKLREFGDDTIDIHVLHSESMYRTAMMSIAGSGKIDTEFEVEFIKGES